MQIQIEQAGVATIVRPIAERLDVEVAAVFRAGLLGIIEQGRRHLVIDLRDVAFVDSSGLGALVSALKTIKRSTSAGDVRLARAQAPVVALLEIIRLNRVFTTYAEIADAVQSYHVTGSALLISRAEPGPLPASTGRESAAP
jgi:anti-sigma B factor antagonist